MPDGNVRSASNICMRFMNVIATLLTRYKRVTETFSTRCQRRVKRTLKTTFVGANVYERVASALWAYEQRVQDAPSVFIARYERFTNAFRTFVSKSSRTLVK